MLRVASVLFIGTLSTCFRVNLQLYFAIHVLVELAAAPLKGNSSSYDGHFDLVYEFVRNVIDYDKPKMTTRVSKLFDTIT
jgi:hypothetical protein